MLLCEPTVTDATVIFYNRDENRKFRVPVHNATGIRYSDVAWSTHKSNIPSTLSEIGKHGEIDWEPEERDWWPRNIEVEIDGFNLEGGNLLDPRDEPVSEPWIEEGDWMATVEMRGAVVSRRRWDHPKEMLASDPPKSRFNKLPPLSHDEWLELYGPGTRGKEIPKPFKHNNGKVWSEEDDDSYPLFTTNPTSIRQR
ncbi:hypothetical protein MBLNU13_g05329t1 [Cladosporium sp. NU13]